MGRWVRFPNATLAYCACGPSRGNLFTGQHWWHTGIRHNEASYVAFDEDIGVYQAVRATGAKTAICGKFINGYNGEAPPGWDYWWIMYGAGGSGSEYLTYSANHNGTILTYGSDNDPSTYSTDVIAAKAVEFIDANANPAGPAFLLWVATDNPHEPFIVATRHNAASVGSPPTIPTDSQTDVSTQPAWIQALSAALPSQETAIVNNRAKARRTLLAMDEAMDDIFAALTAAGVLENTVVFRLTDNGAQWGRWKRLGKSTAIHTKGTPYAEVARSSLHVYVGDDVTPASNPNVVVVLSDDETYGDQDALTMPWLTAQLEAGPTTTRNELVSTLDVTAMIYRLFDATPPVVLDGLDMTPLCFDVTVPWRTDVDLYHATEAGQTPQWAALWRYDPTADPAGREPIYVAWEEWATAQAIAAGGPFAAEAELYPSLTTSGAPADGQRPYGTVNASGDPTHAALEADMAAVLAAKRAQTDGEALNASRPIAADGSRVPVYVSYGDVPVEVQTVTA